MPPDVQGMLLGSFRPRSGGGAKLLTCTSDVPGFEDGGDGGGGNTITHDSNLGKRVVAFDWIPPRGFQGEVYFK